MRGNEFRHLGHHRPQSLEFPIPMRGNESETRRAPIRDRRFPIPMRGNEKLVPAAGAPVWQVSDPHEG